MGIEYLDKTHAKLVVTRGSGKNRTRKVKRITYTSKRDAKRQYDDFERSISFEVDYKLTVGQLLDWYIERFESKGGKPTTLLGYKSVSKAVKEGIGKRKASELSIRDVDEFVRKQSLTYSPKTIKNQVSLVSSAYKDAMRQGLLNQNPCDYVSIPRQVKPSIAILPDADIQTFMEALDRTDFDFKVMCELALFCGLRRSEIMGLRKGDVKDTVTIDKVRHRIDKEDVVETPKTSSSLRTIAVPQFIQKDIESLIAQQAERPEQSDYLILNGFGEPINPSWVTQHMRRVVADAGVANVTFHGLRHTYASMLIAKGIPVSEVSAQLGHASIDITLRTYAHLFTEASIASRHISALMEGIMAPNGHQHE